MAPKDTYDNRVFQILSNEAFTPRFIAGIAGDRIQNAEEKKLYERLLTETGGDFYVKLLFFITHEIFSSRQALELWNGIIAHKEELARTLDRNVEITVATLDYLTNIKSRIKNPKLIGEAFIGKIAEMSSIDPLTKLFNREHLTQVLGVEFTRYERHAIPFSLIMADIDDFKSVNDVHGHQVGDGVLIEVGDILQSTLRDLDVCARYGGEEFVVVLPHTDVDVSREIAERLRAAVVAHFGDGLGITMSFGIATCPTDALTIDAVIKAADDALYSAKRSGKNAVGST